MMIITRLALLTTLKGKKGTLPWLPYSKVLLRSVKKFKDFKLTSATNKSKDLRTFDVNSSKFTVSTLRPSVTSLV